MEPVAQYSVSLLRKELELSAIETTYDKERLYFKGSKRSFSLRLIAGGTDFSGNPLHDHLPLDYLIKDPYQIAALVLSKLGMNKIVFARQCLLTKIDKHTAVQFLDRYHLLHSTQSVYNNGLFYKNELLCLAAFSNGRKMNRLPDDQRSFELIRFCCKPGITVAGGLSKLVKNFASEKRAGDIMTYVDKQLSDGSSFIRAGFKKTEETEPVYFLTNKMTFEKQTLKTIGADYDRKNFYLTRNCGNIKLIYTPREHI